ncbi:uncharacterized protein MONOS_1426 [Monocercomonoides exilis]|uniref:uncharacterized protein n=1 Tax=Monocercomonoides exilis TaxID=2049356 RepID=UPI00355A50FB|nr:hypothetical protein MONOS_1426 [Monocercomonoides exilis]|eukprot:MONOS_1426.1-p1 / transcript=MONOS_1426.1 / gene=MONOS_1426 / organism=Monocercomonoides_exilis_PA203 / gene_product=unspecified product / transcript_product=unspecified product / location=Mono_scaffold00025:106291-115515(-) / protein_length=3074 / sequence_SO=supercontig / SO=protein_coding / is_pseudo=false
MSSGICYLVFFIHLHFVHMCSTDYEEDKKEGTEEFEKEIFQDSLTSNEIQSRNVFEKNATESRFHAYSIQKEDFDEENNKNEIKCEDEYRKRRKQLGSVHEGKERRRSNNDAEKSGIEGNLKMMNSSVLYVDLIIMESSNKCFIEAEKKSCVELKGCILSIGEENSPLKLTESCAVLVNVSLASSTQHLHSIPPLFSSERSENQFEHFGRVSMCSSSFSSFLVTRPPFLSSAFVERISLSNLNFFNISTTPAKTESLSTCQCGKATSMNSCSFHSVCDAYDGGIVPSINNPLTSLTASNTSFVGCCRTRNVEFIGTKDGKLTPGRQNETTNTSNTFIWCEWNGSITTGTQNSATDGVSSGGAIFMYNINNGILNVSHSLFNGCVAYSRGGGILCHSLQSVLLNNNIFNVCTAQNYYGGGLYAGAIISCIQISECEFLKCKAQSEGGGLLLNTVGASCSGCVEEEKGEGESACVFECSFISCTIEDIAGGGIFCKNISFAQFKMRNVQFALCAAGSQGGGLFFSPWQQSFPSYDHYFFFLFFHKCRIESAPYGHDVLYEDYFYLYRNLENPFYECYTTNTGEKRVCYYYYSDGNWIDLESQKKGWLKNGVMDKFVGETGNNTNKWCGVNKLKPCKTIGFAVQNTIFDVTSNIILAEGNHTSEATTIDIGTKKISVIGKGRETCSIGTGALSSVGTLFSVSTGHLGMSHLKIDCNSNASPSPSVVVVTDGGGSLSLEDILITMSNTGEYVISSSVFVVLLSQLSIADAEMKDMNNSQSLFSEPDLSSSLFSSSSSALLLTTSTSKESTLANITVKNVKQVNGDGVVVAKSVAEEETFVVWNSTFEDCECERGSGGGLKVKLESATSKFQMGETASSSGGTTSFSQCCCSGNGGGVLMWLAENSFDFEISSVSFVGCGATLGGKDVFANGSKLVRGTITTTKLNVEHNGSIYDELMGYDRNEAGMGIFPLNVFFDSFSGAAHVGIKKNGFGGFDSWFCGLDYFPCKTITKAAQNRFSSSKKIIVLDSGFELAEVVSMAGIYEWEVYCGINKTNVNVKVLSEMTSSYLIIVESKSSIKNIAFQIPYQLSSATSLITSTSSSLTLTDCSVAHSSESTSSVAFGYSIVNAQSGSLKMDRFVMEEGLIFNGHSAVEFCEGMTSVICSGCNISGVVKNCGDGGWMKGTVGGSGKLTVDGCNMNGCSCVGGKGGGIYVGLKGNGKVVVNGTSVIDGNKAENNGGNGGNGGRGGGMFVLMGSGGCGLTIGENVEFSKVNGNVAEYGKDVFVHCESGVFLESKVNTSSFAFFNSRVISSDVLKLSGSENGDESGVIPLFVYLCTMGTKVIVDGSGGNGMDHSHCGFEGFGCLTVDYCANSRLSESSNEIEVVSSSSIRDEIKISLFGVSISGRIVSSDGERMQVNVSDGGSDTQDWLVGCSSSLTMSRLSFVVKGQMNPRRSAFIHSTSTLNMTNCSVSFESGALTNGKIGYNVINIEGGELIVDGFVMEGGVTMNEKSPISITSGVKLEMNNSQMSGVEVIGEDGGCLNVEMKEGGCVKIELSNLSSICSGGSGMKGGGMMISVKNGGSLEMKNVNLSECEVPSEDSSEKKGGLGGAVFAELPDQMGSFVLEGMKFEGCDAWKGKNMFVSGWVLSKIVNKEHFKWEIKEEELGSLDELCGWERKTTGEGYVIPLVVYLWSNWSGDGFVSKDGGGDFSGCGFSEAPCSSIDHLISLRYEPLREGESHISIAGSGFLSHSISFSSSSSSPPTSPDSESQKMVIEGTKKGTAVIISDEDENDANGSPFISSGVSLILTNLSFSNPNPNSHHEILIESSGANICLSVVDCSFVSLNGMADAGFCVMKVNGGRVVVQGCSLDADGELRGFIAFSATATREAIVEDANISNVGVKERSLISMFEDEQTNGMKTKRGISRGENRHSNNEKVVIKVNGSSFTNITNGENRAGMLSVDSFECAMECVLEGCSVSSCRSEMCEEGGGMKVCLKRGESEVRVVGCSLGMCSCSGVKGRGGGVMVDALDPNEGGASGFGPVGIRMENVRFWGNEAFVGKDVFIRCESIAKQINETLFVLDLSQDALKSSNSICGSDKERNDVDLIPLITFYYGQQVFVSLSGRDDRQCGTQNNPCLSIGSAVKHIQRGIANMLLIDGEGAIGGECVIGDMNVKSLKKTQSTIHLEGKMEVVGDEGSVVVFVNESAVEKCEFLFGLSFESEHSCIVKVKNGTLGVSECWWKSVGMMMLLNSTIVEVEGGELEMEKCVVSCVSTSREILSVCEGSKAAIYQLRMSDIESEDGGIVDANKAKMEAKEMSMSNITRQNRGSIVKIVECAERVDLMNCSMRMCLGKEERGWMVSVWNCERVNVDCCEFDGEEGENEERTRNEQNEGEKREEICKWNGSMVEFEKSEVEMKVTSMRNSKNGGLSVSGGNVVIEKGEFVNNNPSIGKYPSARRNILCLDSAQLNIMSLKGGDGVKDDSSMWILNDGCSLMGIVEERASPLFIPTLRSVETEEKEGVLDVVFRGTLLLPCNLSFRVVSSVGDVELVETHEISESGFVSEEEVRGTIGLEMVRGAEASAEVRVCILFGDGHSPSATESFILKNRSEVESKGDERIVEGGKEGKSIWPIIVVILAVMFLIVFVVSIALAVRWRKVKNEAEDLREIVNDNIRKDPKAFEMVTMEMSPEEQWRRAEKEAEKKNEERIKKRVYGKQMQHSESSEHLLSESGSTEYILGRDSDKIPQWMLEKVDEKEEEEVETRKRTPSPSISSISSTSTTDSDSTFVRREDLCPTTSSMSNLVDAMACSSPHEKLIVDLRDSLFMLLHGRNKTKEMAIGTLQEREQTAAQILFWVANGALHSFDEMENPLSSLSSLSPHIVLFSEHMVICIVMHSDLLSEDSDSSSISSSTIVTSASDNDDDDDSLPSSAFEDEDDFKKECLRWKAPELLINKKMGATKESVAFSIGMMLWECLTLNIPFGEYEAEVAGQKIVNGERPALGSAEQSSFCSVVENCLNSLSQKRPSLATLKRELFQHFPPGAMVLTASDAIDRTMDSQQSGRGASSELACSESEILENRC